MTTPAPTPTAAVRVVGLDDPAATAVAVGGAKAAGLARARASGFPVLDGFVVPATRSLDALTSGRAALERGGSGAARLAVIRQPLAVELEREIAAAAVHLPEPLMVRSSSTLEGRGEWSGAFASLGEVARDELPKAIRSVWATCFSLDVLDRCEEAGIEPGSAPMAVLVQPEIVPDFGGTARVDADGRVTIDAVTGSPRDLLAGWVPGVRATCEAGDPTGAQAVELLGASRLRELADLVRRLPAELGCNLAEWAVHDGRVVLLQVQDSTVEDQPGASFEVLRDLGPVDPGAVAWFVGRYPHLASDPAAPRRSPDHWELQLAGVCAREGHLVTGQPAAGGVGAGRLVWVDSPSHADHVGPRDVVVAQYPLSNFAPLLWKAAAIVTVGGAPNAHLFEVARSLGVPAVVHCPIADVARSGTALGAVDGDTGRVALLP